MLIPTQNLKIFTICTHPPTWLIKSKQSHHPDPHDPSDKRPKLERARSAAEKENHPLQRTGSGLRRQYSHDSSVDMLNPVQRRMQHQSSNNQQHYQSSIYGTNHPSPQSSGIYSSEDDPKFYQVNCGGKIHFFFTYVSKMKSAMLPFSFFMLKSNGFIKKLR